MIDKPQLADENSRKGPLLVGLTGSIGMGKSTIGKIFAKYDIPIFDADAEVHKLQGPGGALIPQIEQAFPGSTNETGVDRQILGAMVLGNPDKLAKLEVIIHPVLAEIRQKFIEQHHDKEMILFDIPLLFEKNGQKLLDKVILVSAPASIQRQRVLERPGMTEEKFNQILSLQMPDAQKRLLADYIIENGGTLQQSEEQVVTLLKILCGPSCNL
ncbi:dephospho-CoA kinase [Sphingorhabdus lutea]|uniref:Dephospho-CoA kinase n=1 Tax=Sphingorhabdus lutea TaxID=1913578 RepID=A0A1L3J9D2_9SPHN|nr:dephospho-CoA kinase [Sphingorhabdus lutea]APG61752.1 dephospho-CoA kinase [Sphingorhabdus lutea]